MKQLFVTIGLIALIVLFLLFNVIDLVVGPSRAQEHALRNTVTLFEKENDEEVSEILNRFSLQQVYAIVRIDDNIVVLLADGQVVNRTPYLALPDTMSHYGYYEEQVVFVKVDENSETYYDMNTNEELFRIEMGD